MKRDWRLASLEKKELRVSIILVHLFLPCNPMSGPKKRRTQPAKANASNTLTTRDHDSRSDIFSIAIPSMHNPKRKKETNANKPVQSLLDAG